MRQWAKIMGMALLVLLIATGCGNTQADASERTQVDADVYAFSDGTTISTWRYPNDNKLLYLLPDGTELLAVTEIGGAKNAIVEGVEPIAALNETAQNAIIEYYQQQGALYDIKEYLEKAYAEYTDEETRPGFRCYTLRQGTVPSGSNETVVYCTTTVLLPLEQGVYDEYSLTQAFDRETGSAKDGWDLFSGEEDEVKAALLSNYTTDTETLQILYADIRPEYIRFYPDKYEIRFPCETSVRLAAKDKTLLRHNIVFCNSYNEMVLAVLHPWAIPNETA